MLSVEDSSTRLSMFYLPVFNLLGEFIAQDNLASSMENVALCLCLLRELYQGDKSTWRDYISKMFHNKLVYRNIAF